MKLKKTLLSISTVLVESVQIKFTPCRHGNESQWVEFDAEGTTLSDLFDWIETNCDDVSSIYHHDDINFFKTITMDGRKLESDDTMNLVVAVRVLFAK